VHLDQELVVVLVAKLIIGLMLEKKDLVSVVTLLNLRLLLALVNLDQ
jgi:hypothetical protein